ncbi:MAG: enoyl-CoA hydratase/isomerase [Xanthomonadaceae bacterium]|nr:enoyl-CoA hydratase/isomerase [Xanthomonadaceae bacterium]
MNMAAVIDAPFQAIDARLEDGVCFLRMIRPDAGNTIDARLIAELTTALDRFGAQAGVVVLEGTPEVFCAGADFGELRDRFERGDAEVEQDPGPLYDLWHRLATGPFISVAHVRGRANAGGVGFVAACDIVLAEEKAAFSLSELLFGLMPACVMPFIVRRMGFAKANFMTLMTQPISAAQALEWGLVDAVEENGSNLLRKQLLRLRRIGRDGIVRYKRYANELDDSLRSARPKALAANREVFSDPDNLRRIARYVRTGKFPWEPE